MLKGLKFSFIAFYVILSSVSNGLIAQENEEKGRIKTIMGDESFGERLSISPSVGWLHSWGDFKTDGFMPSFLQSDANELGYGVLLNVKMSRLFTLSTGVVLGELGGSLDRVNTENASNNSIDYGNGILYRTNMFELTLPRLSFNASRAIFKEKSKFFNKASVLVFVSHGLVFYDSKIYAQSSPETNLLYSKERGRTGKTQEGVTSFGGTFSYIINDKFDLNLESSIRNVYNDKLDAWIGGDHNDKYSYSSIGFTYHIKKRKNVTKVFEPEPLLAADEKKEEVAEEETEIIEPVEVVEEELAENDSDEQESIPEDKDVNDVQDEKDDSIEAKKDAVAVDPPKEDKPAVKTSDEVGYYVAVGAFRGNRANRFAEIVAENGFNPIVIRNKRDTWNLVTVDSYDNLYDALTRMREVRKNGYPESWVHIKK